MNDDELRALVRQVMAQRGLTPASAVNAPLAPRTHPSHGLYVLPTGQESDGPCIIEPAVPCNHCGYCKSHGH